MQMIYDLKDYDKAYEYVSTHEGYVIEDLGNKTYKVVAVKKPSAAEEKARLSELKRNERNTALNTIQWRIDRYKEQSELGIATNDTKETYTQLLNYKQYLRDIPQDKTFPEITVQTFEEFSKTK